MTASSPLGGSEPFFSVVVLTRNRVDVLRQAVASLLAQTFRDFEIVVVDDASRDGTSTRVGELARVEPKVRFLSSPFRLGEAAAKNHGARAARGTWVTFLDDDTAREDWLEKLVLAGRNNSVAVFCGATIREADGATRTVMPSESGGWRRRYRILGLTGAYALLRESFFHVGAYDPSIRFGMHTEFLVRFCRWCREAGLAIGAVAEPLVTINRRAPSRRVLNRSRSEGQVHVAELYLKKYPELRTEDPAFLALQLTVGVVAAARLRDWARCCRWLWPSCRLDPPRVRNWLRLGCALLPGLRNLVWPEALPDPWESAHAEP